MDGALISVGGPKPGSVLDTPEDAWRTAVDSVLLGPLRLVRELVPHLGDGDVEATPDLCEQRPDDRALFLEALDVAQEDVEFDPADPHALMLSTAP